MNFKHLLLAIIGIVVLRIESIEANDCFPNCICSEDQKSIRCSEFSNFEELNFSRPPTKISYLYINPREKLYLNNSLNLKELEFEENAEIELSNIDGFSLVAEIFVFKRNNLPSLRLIIDDSIIYFDAANFDEVDSPIFSLFTHITFLEANSFPRPISSLAFKNARKLSLTFHKLTYPENGFYVVDDPNDFAMNLVSVKFIDCRFQEFDTRILSPKTFRYLTELDIGAEIKSIDDDLFLNFVYLVRLTLDLVNLKTFIRQTGNAWMKQLNVKRDKLFYFTIVDRSKEYLFNEEDLCYFKHFPIQNFVISIVNGKESLDCTCPLAWLMYERSMYEEFDAVLNTSSSYKCVQIHPLVFINYLKDTCEPRVIKCDDDSEITDSSDYSTDYFTDETIETELSSSLSSTSKETTTSEPSGVTSSESTILTQSTTKLLEIKDQDKGTIIGLSVALTVVSIILIIVTIFAVYSCMGYSKLKNFKSDVAYELTSFDKHIDK